MPIEITRQEKQIIQIQITPQQLRKLADDAEKKQSEMKWGDTRTFDTLGSDKGDVEIMLQVPQPEHMK